ncbi:MAG TPA: amidohydrolase family protein [Pirellulaceae bacterium]|jgi:N-acetylglucosamine-6-phosphate deacetylase
MSLRRSNWTALVALALVAGLIGYRTAAAPPSTPPVIGLAQNTPAVFALTNVRIVPEPARVIEKGTIIIRDGVIEAVGAETKPPADARVIDLSGKTAYAGLIDAYGEITIPPDAAKPGAPGWNAQVGPQLDAAEHFTSDDALNTKLRSQGITARLVAPGTRIIKGQSIVVTTAGGDNSRVILKRGIGQHLRLTVSFGQERGSYPSSPMGAVALARQTMLDTDWYAKAWAAYKRDSKLPRPERNDSLDALAPCLAADQPAIIDGSNEQFFLRADRFAREFGLDAVIHGSGREYRRLSEIAATGRSIILPVNFPQPPSVATVEDSLDASLADLMHWDIAPENPARLDEAGVTFALTSHGLRDQATFLAAVRRAVERGLKADSALRAVTTTPASLFNMSERLGKIAPGMAGNLVITDGELFKKQTKVLETWVDGRRFEIERPPVTDVRGSWQLELSGDDSRTLKLNLKITGTTRQLNGTLTKPAEGDAKAEEIRLSQVAVTESQLGFRFEGKSLGKEGLARASATVLSSDGEKLRLLGNIVWSDGTSEKLTGTRTAKLSPQELRQAEQKGAKTTKGKAKAKADDGDAERRGEGEKDDEKSETKASYAVNYPFGDFGRTELPKQSKIVAFKNATTWTCGPAGIIQNGTIVVRDSKIAAIGKDVTIPDGAEIVDAEGRYITPGIIDCHSHMATDGGVNEGSQAITAEVRIGDFIDADDITIYRQLAGGVTAANVLHGSANPIGGQNQVIKLRWGLAAEEMKFANAPPGIKFALGENVKQSNLSDARVSTRYPQSRMGVEQIIRDAFARARDYSAQWDRWNSSRTGLPPRRDLELDALSEILQKKRWVHCHSYRQDEILSLIRIFDNHQITIGSLQHILEGYKVADAMAKHGATGSSFSDWWAYKFEVIDAIPFNGALMHRQKIIVSFNSDDDELGRHLNHEAAKAIKYGGVPAEDALNFVMLNPAKQLRIDRWVGSLEAGKDADLAVWSGDPLSVRSRCEETWIDGRKYFDRDDDRALRTEQAKMRTALIKKILDSGQTMQSQAERTAEEWELWPRHDEACHEHDDH